jgi:hypothetical protein
MPEVSEACRAPAGASQAKAGMTFDQVLVVVVN